MYFLICAVILKIFIGMNIIKIPTLTAEKITTIKNEDNFSSLSVIRQHPPLLWAFWLGIVGLLLFIFFNVKRKQRIINVVKPNVNTTVNFTETVGRLVSSEKK